MRRCFAIVLPVFSLLYLTGCSTNGTGTMKPGLQSSDQAAIQGLIDAAPEFAISFDDDGEISAVAGAPAVLSGAAVRSDGQHGHHRGALGPLAHSAASSPRPHRHVHHPAR